ncbi:MAG: hypothetical protein ACREH9_01030, partial [Pseudomonadota bacterium]
MPRIIDIHSHVLADGTIKLLQREIPSLGLKLTPIDGDNSIMEVAGVAYRPFPRGGHDLARRLADMGAASVDMHVLSAAPQTWLYDQEASIGIAAAAIQNEEIARLVKERPNHFIGIATLPMQAPEKAAAELC